MILPGTIYSTSAFIALAFLLVADHVFTRPTCRDDQYWQRITGTCEPCHHICDPPRRHENDCPKWCPNYHPTTTTASTTTPSTPLPSHNVSTTHQKTSHIVAHETTESGSNGMPWYGTATIVVVGVILLQIPLGCVVYKERTACKKTRCLRRFFKKPEPPQEFDEYPVTMVAEYPTDPDGLDEQEADPERQSMLTNESDDEDK